MVTGWAGADPVQQDDGATTYYELATRYRADADVTISAVRVWHGAASNTLAGRHATIWTNVGAQLATVNLTDTLPPGWTSFDLATPLPVTSGTTFVVSYGTRQYYGAVTPAGYPAASSDLALVALAGLFIDGQGNVGNFPTNATTTFYGIDVVYTLGIGDNTAPSVTLATTPGPLSVTATATVVDDAAVTQYLWKWGDGTTSSTSVASASHTYTAPGIYAVLVIVTDAGGLKDSAAAVAVVRGLGGGLNLSEVAVEIAERLALIDGLNAFHFQPGSIVPPAAIVLNPNPGDLEYDKTYGRGLDRVTLPLVVFVGRADVRTSQELARLYLDGSGAKSIKTALEAGSYASLHTIRVTVGGVDGYSIGAVEHLVALLELDIAGNGR